MCMQNSEYAHERLRLLSARRFQRYVGLKIDLQLACTKKGTFYGALSSNNLALAKKPILTYRLSIFSPRAMPDTPLRTVSSMQLVPMASINACSLSVVPASWMV